MTGQLEKKYYLEGENHIASFRVAVYGSKTDFVRPSSGDLDERIAGVTVHSAMEAGDPVAVRKWSIATIAATGRVSPGDPLFPGPDGTVVAGVRRRTAECLGFAEKGTHPDNPDDRIELIEVYISPHQRAM